MRAAWFESFGPAKDVLRVGEMDTPQAGPGQVLVRMYTSGVNPSDVKKRAGSFPNLLDEGPVIPNSDGAGVIEAVGDGVSANRIGERVWIYQAQFARRLGTAAEYVAIDDSRAPRLADNASFDVGACLGIPAMTAHRCVFADGDVDGRTVLVTGGAGRVGHYAIQWASQAGAKVIATASNDLDAAACTSAGANTVVNHRDDNFSASVLDATNGEPVDRIVDTFQHPFWMQRMASQSIVLSMSSLAQTCQIPSILFAWAGRSLPTRHPSCHNQSCRSFS